jgi:glutaminase
MTTVNGAYERFEGNTEGSNSDVYPALARVPSDLFGVCIIGTSGKVYSAGDADHEFSIMSVSKPFVFVLVCQNLAPKKRATNLVSLHDPGNHRSLER